MNVSGGATTEATISGLNSATTYMYSIEVAAVNGAGTGDYSNSISAITSGTYRISSIRPCAPIRPRPQLDRAPLRYLSRIVRALE